MPKDPADPHQLSGLAEAAPETIQIATEGPDSEAHARQIEALLRGHEGVIEVRADPEHARVLITFDRRKTHAPNLHDLILGAGYQPSPHTPLATGPAHAPDSGGEKEGAVDEGELPLTDDEFSQYITFHAARFTPDQIDDLTEQIPALREQFADVRTTKLPKAPAQFALLADLVEAFSAGSAVQVPFEVVVEAAVALDYLQRPNDLIPDSLPDIGFLDDAAMAQTVFARHPEVLEAFASERGIDWEEVEAA